MQECFVKILEAFIKLLNRAYIYMIIMVIFLYQNKVTDYSEIIKKSHLVLTPNIPHSEANVLVFDSLHIEACIATVSGK